MKINVERQNKETLSYKPSRLTRSQADALELFQQFPVEAFAGMQQGYWIKAMDAGTESPFGCDLPRMGVELNAIPGMSALSSNCTYHALTDWYRGRYTSTGQRSRLADDVIEAIECLKSWAREDLVYGMGSDVRKVEEMLRDLEQQSLGMSE
jgi:hypothetical protein